jgi:hypothetical protein
MAVDDSKKLEGMNHSELVATARWNDLPASRAFSREELLRSLRTLTPIEKPNPFDAMRTSMSAWLIRWWDKLQMQAAKKVCPNCFECRDIQILDCYTKNEASIRKSE